MKVEVKIYDESNDTAETTYFLIMGHTASGTRYFRTMMENLGIFRGSSTYSEVIKERDPEKAWQNMCVSTKQMGEFVGTFVHIPHQIIEILQVLYPNVEITEKNTMKYLTRKMPYVKFIYITRLNKFHKAIADVRAQKNGKTARLFMVDSSDSVEDYNMNELYQKTLKGISDEINTLVFFESNDIEPLYITYEELCQDRLGVLKRVVAFLDISVSEKKIKEVVSAYYPKRTDTAVKDELFRQMMKQRQYVRIEGVNRK
ncbi:MAG: Stf0 family sulfotransferase [Candidatus Poribacteria bacterium]|nr:Stf0 family sulfotransferase [Candidatus Poribacteria bacterium]